MEQTEREVISVTELNLYIKDKIESDFLLRGILVRGEISNFKRYSSGHCYFTLKDEACAVRAVMFKFDALSLNFQPTDGMKVIALGRAGVYERDGQYQLYVSQMRQDGLGSLYEAYENLKAKLNAEGLFDENKKRPIPEFPNRIGVITSPTGAAVRDIINITGRRYPSAEVVVYPAIVQGSESVPTLLAGLNYFGYTKLTDVIIIGRGGGSIEDLWSFNDERVVRAVAASPVPVISAVGHETDFTLCDFAADLRAPTPSAAAECATPDREQLTERIAQTKSRLTVLTEKEISARKDKLKRLSSSRVLTDPQNFILDRKVALDIITEKLTDKLKIQIQNKKTELKEHTATLNALNPLSVLSRGYSAAFDENGNVIKSINQIKNGEKISTKVSDGTIISTVMSTEKNEVKKHGKEKNEF